MTDSDRTPDDPDADVEMDEEVGFRIYDPDENEGSSNDPESD
jgi:hypothetical protein